MDSVQGSSLNTISKTLRSVVDFFVPPRCLKCRQSIRDDKTLCISCWKELTFITTPYCACCGYPFEMTMEAHSLCGACHHRHPLYTKARSAIYYDDASKPLILRFKHYDATHLAPLFGKWMYNASHDVLATTDYLAPIPLHWRRLFKRRYNQAALLTNELARLAQRPVGIDILTRIRHTPFQGRLSSVARHQNVNNVFRVRPSWQNKIKDKTVTLVDDVVASGATINSCVKVLLEAGVSHVNVLTLARVV